MHKLLKGYSESAFASPFPWMADEVELLEVAGFHDIKVSFTSHTCMLASHSHHALLNEP